MYCKSTICVRVDTCVLGDPADAMEVLEKG
jgi:hypothetical protein